MAKFSVVKLPYLTKEFIRFSVSAKDSGALVDPTVSSPTQMALTLPEVNPASGDWKPATWEVDNSGPYPVYYCRATAGIGATLDPGGTGTYDVWCKLTYAAETPARKVGVLILF
jgi:hypothetical protein